MPKQKEGHIGDKLLAAIKAKGVSQADVARRFGVAPATVSADWIKHGRIAKKHIPLLVDYFGLPYQYWLGAEETGNADESIATVLTDRQQQMLSLMRNMGDDELQTWLKVGASLAGLPDKASNKPEKAHKTKIIPSVGATAYGRILKKPVSKLRRATK